MAQTFGPYRLIRRIAAGGMGEVWLAVLERQGGFAKTIALKTILPSLAARPGFADRFQAEASTAALLNHPNIVQVFDHGSIDERSFLTMEYVEGPDLAGLLQAGQAFSPAVAVELAVQLCRGLGHAHERRDLGGRPVGIVHGDLSPSNVLLSCDGVAKIADFGLARLRGADPAVGAIDGKICYMSPEQASGQPLDSRSDLFSLGMVLYELLCGQRAYPLLDPPGRTLEAVRTGRIAPPDEVARGPLPAGLGPVLQRTLAPDPAARFPSASELARELAAVCPPCGPEELGAFVRAARPALADPGLASPEPTEVACRPVSPRTPIGQSRRRLWGWIAGLGLVCWAAGFGWWLWHDPPAARPRPPRDSRPQPPGLLTAALVQPSPAENQPAAAADRPPESRRTRPQPRDSTARIVPTPVLDPPAQAAAPEPARLELRLAPGLAAALDHRTVQGPLVRILEESTHLVRVTPAQGGEPELLLRLVPPDPTQPRWRLNIQSTPWMRIWLAGRPAGQTPRSGLVLPAGDTTLELRRGEQILRLGLRIPAPGANP